MAPTLDHLDLAAYMELADRYRGVQRVPNALVEAIDTLVSAVAMDRAARMDGVERLSPREFHELMKAGWKDDVELTAPQH